MKIAVIGVGTAGVVSVGHLLANTLDAEIYSIYDPNTPILGIGESTTVQMPVTLFQSTRFNLLRDSSYLDATVKYGVKYVGWREQDFNTLIVPPATGLHFNNFRLQEFCFTRFEKIWKNRFKVIHASVLDITSTGSTATVITEDQQFTFDWVIDCRGYPEDYSDYHMSTALPLNHCLVNMIPKPGDWTWTYHTAHRNGWMFGIPLQTRQGWGYLYNDEITSKEDAIDDIAERFQTPAADLNLREFKFRCYHAKTFIKDRICVNGNRALFYEPMEALSGWFYSNIMQVLTKVINQEVSTKDANTFLSEQASDYHSFICFVYHGGSNYDSEFWRNTRQRTSMHLMRDYRFQQSVAQRRQLFEQRSPDHMLNTDYMLGQLTWVDLDRHLGYNLFTKKEHNHDF